MDGIRIEVTVRVTQQTSSYEYRALASAKQELEGSMPLPEAGAEIQRLTRLVEGESLRQLGITMEQKRLEEAKRLVTG